MVDSNQNTESGEARTQAPSNADPCSLKNAAFPLKMIVRQGAKARRVHDAIGGTQAPSNAATRSFSTEIWLKKLGKAYTNTKTLLEKELLTAAEKQELEQNEDLFDIRVPEVFHTQLENEALKKQFCPSSKELIFLPEELTDPIGDETHSPVEGITHRYPDRVLLKPTYLCASYCRFCFRRYKVSNSEHNLTWSKFERCIEYIQYNKNIWEVILTGGDPLVLNDTYLDKILTQLNSIEHVKIIRFHTRIPSVLPERITDNLLSLLQKSNKSIWISVHINSHLEFTESCKQALKLLKRAGIPLLLQSVLLKDVNDTKEQLINLFKTAVENKVKPYYLHYTDLAKGTSHFRIPLQEAIELIASLRGKISGLCIPPLVVDIPGGQGKICLEKKRAWIDSSGHWHFESPL